MDRYEEYINQVEDSAVDEYEHCDVHTDVTL